MLRRAAKISVGCFGYYYIYNNICFKYIIYKVKSQGEYLVFWWVFMVGFENVWAFTEDPLLARFQNLANEHRHPFLFHFCFRHAAVCVIFFLRFYNT